MKKETFNLLKKELMYISLLFLITIIIFKIAFFKERLVVLFKVVLSLFWLFILPCYFTMLYWCRKFEFMERLIIGTALSAGVIGILSYYIGLAGLNIKYHTILLPLAIIVAGLITAVMKKETSTS